MRPSLSRLRPSAIELWYVGFAAFALVLISNGKLLLERAGLIGSADLIGKQVSTKVLSGNNLIDTFRFTANITDLIVWGLTGLIIYSFLQSIFGALRTIEYERDFDSGQFVHPQEFTHEAYWRQIIYNGLLGFLLLGLLAASVLVYIIVVIPCSSAYIDRFILVPTLPTVYDPFIGFDIAFIGTLAVYLFLRLVIRHHRASAITEE